MQQISQKIIVPERAQYVELVIHNVKLHVYNVHVPHENKEAIKMFGKIESHILQINNAMKSNSNAA